MDTNNANDRPEKEPQVYWWNNREACRLLDVSPRTMQTYRDNRLIKFSQLKSKIWYKDEWIQEFLEKHQKP